MNAQSLMAHKDEIQHQIMKKMKPAFLALSETRLIEDIEDSEVNVPGYSVARCDAENRNTGGVMLYVRNDIIYQVILKEKIISNCWCIAVEVKSNMYKGVIAVVYHSPSASDGDFIRFLENIVNTLIVKKKCIVMGDVNINLLTDSFYTKKLKTEMLCLGMKQYVDKPTRVTKDSKTLIDVVFANININCRVHDEPKITDHSCISVEFVINKKYEKYREITSRDYSKFHIGEFLSTVETSLEHNDELELNLRAEKFVQSIVSALDTTAPKKKFRIPKIWEGKKWYSEEIRIATKKRDESYTTALNTNTEQAWLQFKFERNMVVKLIRRKRKEYYEDMIDKNKNDPRMMWKTLKEIIKGEDTGTRKIHNVDFEILNNTEECELADKFNLYYTKSIKDITKTINRESNSQKTIYTIENKGMIENFELVDVHQVERIIMNLPHKKGTDEGISSDLMKASVLVIKRELMGIINDSLSRGICPEGWKTSTIIPIPKIAKPNKASEYRPINVLPIYEKVLELVVKNQIEIYIENNKIITEHQSGFRKNHSCETAIQTVIDDWKLTISEGEIIGVIFLDLKRAFETVDREILLDKLYQYGMRGMVLKWLKSYLNNRTQKVKFNNQCSKSIITEYGVPQGSVLGPLLFSLYINDIIQICPKECTIKMFADDTIIYVKGGGSAEIETRLNEVLHIIEKWMNNNGLKMNATKTKYMLIKSVRKELRKNTILKGLDGTEIERVEKIKYLGVIIDSELKFDDHCDYMLKKIGKKISFLNRIGNSISDYTRCIVYKSIIAPHFEYCATLLVGMGETQLSKLQIMQNRAMRVIIQCNRYTRVEEMLQVLQFMSIRQRLYYNVCIFIFKIIKGMLPIELGNKIVLVEGRTRQADNIMIQFRRTKSAQKSLFYEGIKMYNDIPTELKQCDSLIIFKRKLKEYILQR